MAEAVLGIVVLLILITSVRMVRNIKGFQSSQRNMPAAKPVNREKFQCKVDILQELSEEGVVETFVVQIRGQVRVPTEMHDTDIQVLLADITDDSAHPVLSTAHQWQMDDSVAFCYFSHNGKIPRQEYTLSNWVSIAQIRSDVLIFPRCGLRKLEFVTSLISRETGVELVCGSFAMEYKNDQLGYIDTKENKEQSAFLSVKLATMVGLQDAGLNESAKGIIREWAANAGTLSANNSTSGTTDKGAGLILEELVKNLLTAEDRDIDSVCRELSVCSAIPDRYNAMKLCLKVAGSGGPVGGEGTVLLSRIAEHLEIDKEKFRAMAQKVLQIATDEELEVEFILGISADMSREAAREHLNNEYQKWNARVTHPDPAIQAQADQMLRLIAEARGKYVEQACSG